MKGKKEFFILIVIIGILAFYLAWRKTDQENYQLPQLQAINQGDVTHLEITGPKGPVTLTLKNDNWQVGPKGYPADPQKVRSMLGALDDLTLTAMVSDSQNYGRYGLGPEKQISIKAWAGDKQVRDLLIGRAADSYRQTFVMLAGDQRVYHAEGNIRGDFDQSMEDLRDRTVLSFDSGTIEGLTLEHGTSTLDLRRMTAAAGKGKDGAAEEKDGAKAGKAAGKVSWQTANGKSVDGGKVDDLLSSLTKLRCSAFLDKKKEGLKKPLCRLSLAGDREYSLSIFAPQDKTKGYPAISSQSDYPFLLPQAKAENILKAVKKMGR
jgi:hypothetical protein